MVLNKKILKTLSENEGWTFIETLIVMTIVLILTASVGFGASKQLDKARVVSAQSQIESISMALDSYYMDNGFYPSKSQGLDALWKKPSGLPVPAEWNGPYISKKIGADPWGNEYIYSVPGENGLPYEVCSLGKDGMKGGSGNDKDISSSR